MVMDTTPSLMATPPIDVLVSQELQAGKGFHFFQVASGR
jgi:hypothetical protein